MVNFVSQRMIYVTFTFNMDAAHMLICEGLGADGDY